MGAFSIRGRSVNVELKLLRQEAMSSIGTLQKVLLKFRVGVKLRRLLEQADSNISPGTLVLSIAVFSLIGLLVSYMFGAGIVLSCLISGLMGFVPILVIMRKRTRRFNRFEMQFPDAIDLLSRAIRAGHALNTGIQIVADEMPAPVGKEFKRVFEEQKYGLAMKAALLNMVERIDLLDLRLFVVAILIQSQSGGNLAELLEKISRTIRERFRIKRQLKVHTAQAKLTGIILMSLPPVMGGVTLALNYEYMKIIFEEPLGIQILTAAAVLQVVGLFWIRRVVNIQV